MYIALSTFSQVALMNESRYDMAVFEIEVIMGTINVRGDHTGEHAAILLIICPNLFGKIGEKEKCIFSPIISIIIL